MPNSQKHTSSRSRKQQQPPSGSANVSTPSSNTTAGTLRRRRSTGNSESTLEDDEQEETDGDSSANNVEWSLQGDEAEDEGIAATGKRESIDRVDLQQFRSEWKQEIQRHRGLLDTEAGGKSDSGSGTNPGSRTLSPGGVARVGSNGSIQLEIYDKAKDLFLQGIDSEQKGCMHDAIRFYHQAVHLVPDIEKKLFSSWRIHHNSRKGSQQVSDDENAEDSDTEAETEEEGDGCLGDGALADQLETRLPHSETTGERRICLPAQPQGGTHIGELPVEVLLSVFKWVIGCELDARMLETLGRVSAGFYVLSRDSELWRQLCLRTWGARMGILDQYCPSWREMYLDRPHLFSGGVYIAKITYVRYGETGYQDQFYRPWHLVVYYRYLRFFADGSVLMLTTADEPLSVVPYLNTRHPRIQGILKGRFRLIGKDGVSARLTRKPQQAVIAQASSAHADPMAIYARRRPAVQQNPNDVIEQTFNMELRIRTSAKRRQNHRQLQWTSYETTTTTRRHLAAEGGNNNSESCFNNGCCSHSQFDLNDTHFPNFYYSRVKSYSARCEDRPLS